MPALSQPLLLPPPEDNMRYIAAGHSNGGHYNNIAVSNYGNIVAPFGTLDSNSV